MNKARVESFSDGVFAFAITLLVLGVQVPEIKSGADSELRAALIHSISQLLPYVTSFATIGIIWLNHHSMFHSVQRVEHTTLTLDLLLLLVVGFIPYPTAVLSRYGALPSSAFLYGSVLVYARHLLLAPVDAHRALERINKHQASGEGAFPQAWDGTLKCIQNRSLRH
jgi:uncharacterized membrane protein